MALRYEMQKNSAYQTDNCDRSIDVGGGYKTLLGVKDEERKFVYVGNVL